MNVKEGSDAAVAAISPAPSCTFNLANKIEALEQIYVLSGFVFTPFCSLALSAGPQPLRELRSFFARWKPLRVSRGRRTGKAEATPSIDVTITRPLLLTHLKCCVHIIFL